MKRQLLNLLFCLMLWPAAAPALSVGDVEVPEEARIAGVERPLVLNGAGVRKKFFISVYVGALYLAERQVGVGSLLSVPAANRVSMHFVYDKVTRRQLAEGWHDGFANNLSKAELAKLGPRLDRFIALFRDMRAGDTIWLDFVPGAGTRVSINGATQGMIEGDDFNLALLSVWLGAEPVTEALKNAMVGVDKD